MPDPKRPKSPDIPRVGTPEDSDELTVQFAVPRHLLEQLVERGDDDDLTHVGPVPVELLEEEKTRQPSVPPQPARQVHLPASAHEVDSAVNAMQRPRRVARVVALVALVVIIAGALLLGAFAR